MVKDKFPVYDISQLAEFKHHDLLISQFAPYLAIHKNLQQAHKHNFYHLVFFTEGRGSHTIDFEKFEVKPYQLYFMIPGQVHQWNFEGQVDGYVVNFSPDFFQSFLVQTGYLNQFSFFSGDTGHAVIDLPDKQQQIVLDLFKKLLAEYEEKQPSALDMIRVLLLQLFIVVNRLSSPQASKQASPYNLTLLQNYQQLIEKNYLSLRLPKEYAALLYITPNHLNALSHDLLGISAGEVIRNRVILETKRLLVNQELGIAEIASQLNFTDNSYFTKFFKKQAGITPEEFRKQLITEHHENAKLS
jgi:AraC-like DNA-binding protein